MSRAVLVVLLVSCMALSMPGCGADDEKRQDASSPSTTDDVPRTSVTKPTSTSAATTSPDVAEQQGAAATSAPAEEAPEERHTPSGSRDVFAPAAGRYHYISEGWTERRGPATDEREEHRVEEVDEITTTAETPSTMTVLTTIDGERQQSLGYELSADGAALRELTTWSAGPTNSGLTIRPVPPIPVAKLPYRVGQKWEFAWRDSSAGMQGVGRGHLLREEQVTTASRLVDTVVLEVRQRLSGAFNGEIVTTAWIEPETGTMRKQVIVSDASSAEGATHTETTRTLRSIAVS